MKGEQRLAWNAIAGELRKIQQVQIRRYRGFNNEVQHLEKQEGDWYSKWIWENNTGI